MRYLLLIVVMLPLTGCYYMQAAAGQWEVVRKREPVTAVIADPDTSPELAARLALLQEARDFSITELGLPDNDSYRTYADLERDYIVWNVFAAPEFSVTPKKWCFPVTGCVSYRGFFSRDKAQKSAERLRDKGYDVAVGGVAAYSTLGKFDDPILNTMLRSSDTELAGLLFHELAHQVVYVKDDTAFNESFATAVEEAGVRRWLRARGREEEYGDYDAKRAYRQELMRTAAAARRDLRRLYSNDEDDDSKRRRKRERLQALSAAVTKLAEESGRRASGWLTGEINNAHLISIGLYEGRLPEFREMLADCDGDLPCFYERVRQVAAN